MKPLLAVRHQASAHLGVTAEMLRAEGVPYTYLDAWAVEEWPDVRSCSGLVVLGGEMNTDQFDDHPWLKDVRGLVDDALTYEVPMLGICLGAQTLARALGAEVRRSPVKEVGFRRVELTPEGRADPLTASFSDVPVFQWHEDAFELPAGATLLCAGDVVAHQAFRAGERAYGVQFHFEVDDAVIGEWCDETDADVLHEGWGVTKEGLLEEARRFLPAQRAAAAQAIRAFAGVVRA